MSKKPPVRTAAQQAKIAEKQRRRTRRNRAKQLRLWLAGARPRTLPLALAPVIIGIGVAAGVQAFNLGLSLLALAVALFLQIGVNYANDYSDGIRGTDNFRVGPMRLTGSKAVVAGRVRLAAFICFGLAGLAGLAVVAITQVWWLLAVGALAVLAAWFYTGGKRPYGYAGFGELAAFAFFGPVASVGTAYIQIGAFEGNSLVGGIAAGSFAAAVLLVNNIRDIQTDAHAGKRTLAVRLGAFGAKLLFALLIALPYLTLLLFNALYPATWAAWFTLMLAVPAVLIVFTGRTPKEQILALKLTSYAAFAFAVLLALGLYRVVALF